MNNGNREFQYIHLRRGNSCSTCPYISLATVFLVPFALCLALFPSPFLLPSSSVFAASALHYARFFFFFFSFLFFVPPPPPLFAPFLFVNYKSQLTLSFSLFLYFYLFYFIFFWGRVVVQTWEIVEELTFEDVVLGFFLFCLVLHSLSFLGVGVFLFSSSNL